MILPEWFRLCLYVFIAVIPMWLDWVLNKWDLSVRGLLIPILGSLLTGATVLLARTKSDESPPPPENPPDP